MMPNATINRWIDNIKLFHFTLRHKNGATFGPDRLSRRLPQPEDEVYPNPFEKNEDPGGPPEVVIADPTEPQLLKYRKVTRPGIEPRTFWTYTRCSNQLSYLALEFNQLILYLCNYQPKDTYSARHIQCHSLHARSTL